jgi:hypothetical protein
MKFIAIAALVATASAAEVKTGEKCDKDNTCPSTDCCGTVSKQTTQAKDTKALKTGVAAKVCNTKDKKTFDKKYDAKVTTADDFVDKDAEAGTYQGDFKCDATGAASLSAAVAVLAASYYMA